MMKHIVHDDQIYPKKILRLTDIDSEKESLISDLE